MAQQFLDYRLEVAERRIEKLQTEVDGLVVGMAVLKAKVAIYAAIGAVVSNTLFALVTYLIK